jgi:hypothetical protein
MSKWEPPKSDSKTSEKQENSFVPPEARKSKPATDIGGGIGAVTRGLAPTAAYTAIGAALGAPFAGVGAIPGAAAANIAFPLADLAIDTINSNLGTDFYTIHGAVTGLLDNLGTPKPDSAAEKVIESVSSGVGGGYGGAKSFQALEKLGATVPEALMTPKKQALQEAYRALGEGPTMQAAIGGVGAGTAQAVEEMGGDPILQGLAGITAGLAIPAGVGGVKFARKQILPPSEATKQKEAAEIAQQIFQKAISQKDEVFEPISRAKEVTDKYVKPMTGDISGDPGLIALQDALERSSGEISKRQIENIQGLAQKLGKGLEETGAPTAETEEYFRSTLKNITDRTSEEISKAKSIGDTESAALMEEAAKKVNEIQEKVDLGKFTAEEGMRQATKNYEDLFTNISKLKEGTIKDKLSESTFQNIKDQREVEKAYINNVYKAAEPDIPPFLAKNTANVEKDLLEYVEYEQLPSVAKLILSKVKDKEGNLQLRTFGDIRKNIQAINAELRKVQASGGGVDGIILGKLKEALNKDIDSLEGFSDILKFGNKLYRDYVKIYKEGASGKAFLPQSFISKTIDQYIGQGEAGLKKENIQQLRNAILGTGNVPEEFSKKLKPDIASGVADLPQPATLLDKEKLPLSRIVSPEDELSFLEIPEQEKVQTGIRNVIAWIAGKMSGELSGADKIKSIDNWLLTKGNRILDVFPEARPFIINVRNKFEDLQNLRNSAEEQLNKAKNDDVASGKKQIDEINKEYNAKLDIVKERYDQEIKKLERELSDTINPKANPVAKFIDDNPEEVIAQAIYNPKAMAKLIEQAQQDTTGKAMQGLQNVGKRWLNSQVRNFSKPSATTGIPDPVATINSYRVDLGKISKLLEKPSATRKSLEMLLGENSSDLAILDEVRRQIDIISRTSKQAAPAIGGPETFKKSDSLDSLLSILGIGLVNAKGYVVWKGIDLIRNLQRRSNKEIGEQVKQILIDAHLVPEVGYQLAQPITPQSVPKTISLLKHYGIQARASDFGIEEDAGDKDKKQIP